MGITNWYAVQTKSFKESFVAASLTGKGYPTVLPTYMDRRAWADRVLEVERPLFQGYVFAHFPADFRLPILETPGVIQIVSAGRVPVPVDEREMLAVRTLVSSGAPAEPWPYLHAGQRVMIRRGPLRDLEGVLIDFKKRHRIVISVTLLCRSVAVEIERTDVQPVLSERRAPQSALHAKPPKRANFA